jgi:hypothetical protein
MKQSVFDKLTAVARAHGLVSYTELGRAADLDVADREQLDRLVRCLDEITLEDIQACRPLLACVVVRADTQMPSKGLFKFAKKHGAMRGQDEMGFWSTELGRLYAHYGARGA